MLSSVQERGQGLVEYALLIVLVAIVAIATFLILGPAIGNAFTRLNSRLSSL
jgi:pilus assembly protein Flp/PilA